MFVDQIEASIADASSAALVEINRAIWQGLNAGALTEEDAGRLAEAIHARQTAAKAVGPVTCAKGRPVGIFPPRRPQRPPERSVAIERRRRLAASGPLPPALAARFTTSEAAVMRIVGDECRDKGRCVLPIDAIAARAGVGRTTVQNAIRLARRLGMVEIEERRQQGAKNLPNRVTVVDREWRQWLERGPRRHPATGFRNSTPTETGRLSMGGEGTRDARSGERIRACRRAG